MLVNGNNLTAKENHKKKYQDDRSQIYLAEIREKYDQWHKQNLELIGPVIVYAIILASQPKSWLINPVSVLCFSIISDMRSLQKSVKQSTQQKLSKFFIIIKLLI